MSTPDGLQFQILMGLNRFRKHVYAGTVAPEVVAKRRAKNRVARRQRKINARGGRRG